MEEIRIAEVEDGERVERIERTTEGKDLTGHYEVIIYDLRRPGAWHLGALNDDEYLDLMTLMEGRREAL